MGDVSSLKYLNTAWSYTARARSWQAAVPVPQDDARISLLLITAWNQDARSRDLIEPILEPSLAFYTRPGWTRTLEFLE